MKTSTILGACIVWFIILTSLAVASPSTVEFNITPVYYDGLDNCSILINETRYINTTLINNTEQTAITVDLTDGQDYEWSSQCCYEGLCDTSSTYYFSIAQSVSIDLNWTPTWYDGIDNCSVWTNKTEWSNKYITVPTVNNTELNYTHSYGEGHYMWNVVCCYEGICDWNSANQTFIVSDAMPSTPKITLTAPVDIYVSVAPSDITYTFSVSDGTYSTVACNLYENDSIIYTNASVNVNESTSLTKTYSSAIVVDWYVNCSNAAGNSNVSTTRSFELEDVDVITTLNGNLTYAPDWNTAVFNPVDWYATGNYIIELTESGIDQYPAESSTFTVFNNNSLSLNIQLKTNVTSDRWDWICNSVNVTGTFSSIVNVSSNTTENIDCTLNLYNISQTYENFVLTQDFGSWEFGYEFQYI